MVVRVGGVKCRKAGGEVADLSVELVQVLDERAFELSLIGIDDDRMSAHVFECFDSGRDVVDFAVQQIQQDPALCFVGSAGECVDVLSHRVCVFLPVRLVASLVSSGRGRRSVVGGPSVALARIFCGGSRHTSRCCCACPAVSLTPCPIIAKRTDAASASRPRARAWCLRGAGHTPTTTAADSTR